MLLPARVAAGVRDGTISVAFRRWEQPRVRVGGTQLTSAGIVRFDAVEEVFDPAGLTAADAAAAGYGDVATLRRQLWPPSPSGGATRSAGPRASRGGDHVYRVRLSWVGEDPRPALRERTPGGTELADLGAAVAKLDAGRRSGPWTRRVLEWIRDNPGVISTELAALLGREVLPLKADIRRLKALGLTESLRVGYRLSPRGRAYLDSLD